MSCFICQSTTLIKTCSQCKNVMYCSEACQTVDWRGGHKEKCKKVNVYSFLDQLKSDASRVNFEENLMKKKHLPLEKALAVELDSQNRIWAKMDRDAIAMLESLYTEAGASKKQIDFIKSELSNFETASKIATSTFLDDVAPSDTIYLNQQRHISNMWSTAQSIMGKSSEEASKKDEDEFAMAMLMDTLFAFADNIERLRRKIEQEVDEMPPEEISVDFNSFPQWAAQGSEGVFNFIRATKVVGKEAASKMIREFAACLSGSLEFGTMPSAGARSGDSESAEEAKLQFNQLRSDIAKMEREAVSKADVARIRVYKHLNAFAEELERSDEYVLNPNDRNKVAIALQALTSVALCGVIGYQYCFNFVPREVQIQNADQMYEKVQEEISKIRNDLKTKKDAAMETASQVAKAADEQTQVNLALKNVIDNRPNRMRLLQQLRTNRGDEIVKSVISDSMKSYGCGEIESGRRITEELIESGSKLVSGEILSNQPTLFTDSEKQAPAVCDEKAFLETFILPTRHTICSMARSRVDTDIEEGRILPEYGPQRVDYIERRCRNVIDNSINIEKQKPELYAAELASLSYELGISQQFGEEASEQFVTQLQKTIEEQDAAMISASQTVIAQATKLSLLSKEQNQFIAETEQHMVLLEENAKLQAKARNEARLSPVNPMEKFFQDMNSTFAVGRNVPLIGGALASGSSYFWQFWSDMTSKNYNGFYTIWRDLLLKLPNADTWGQYFIEIAGLATNALKMLLVLGLIYFVCQTLFQGALLLIKGLIDIFKRLMRTCSRDIPDEYDLAEEAMDEFDDTERSSLARAVFSTIISFTRSSFQHVGNTAYGSVTFLGGVVFKWAPMVLSMLGLLSNLIGFAFLLFTWTWTFAALPTIFFSAWYCASVWFNAPELVLASSLLTKNVNCQNSMRNISKLLFMAEAGLYSIQPIYETFIQLEYTFGITSWIFYVLNKAQPVLGVFTSAWAYQKLKKKKTKKKD